MGSTPAFWWRPAADSTAGTWLPFTERYWKPDWRGKAKVNAIAGQMGQANWARKRSLMHEHATQPLHYLYQSLNQHKRPEDVTDAVLQLIADQISAGERKLLDKAARGSIRQNVYHSSSMLDDFAKPVGTQRQVAKAQDLFQTAYPLTTEQCDDPDEVEKFIHHISLEIRKTWGRNDFKADRLNRKARREAALELSRRRYNKLFRHLTRLEAKLARLTRELRKLKFTKIGKSALGYELSWAAFSHDLSSACFVAYYVARCNLRSEFTIYGQQRPYDEIADMLFKRCTLVTTTAWTIARVYPHRDVLAHLGDSQKGELLGHWFSVLQDIAAFLEEVWDNSHINRQTMIVAPGNDSTTWNNTASAWNKARNFWFELLYSLGLEEILESVCPGKVMRLMAADVAWWHCQAGNSLDVNTFVWNELPLPWEVLSGRAICTLDTVKQACAKLDVDPSNSGWIAPRAPGGIAAFSPTPELVHGVSLSSPFLAKALRNAGFISAKTLTRPPQPGDTFVHDEVLRQHNQRLTQGQDDLE